MTIQDAIKNSKNNPNVRNGTKDNSIDNTNKFNLTLNDRVRFEKEKTKLINLRKNTAKEIEEVLKTFNSKEEYSKSYNEIPEEYKKYLTVKEDYINIKIKNNIDTLKEAYEKAKYKEGKYDDKQNDAKGDKKDYYKGKERRYRAESSELRKYINKINNEQIAYNINDILKYSRDIGKYKEEKYENKVSNKTLLKPNSKSSSGLYSAVIDGKTYNSTNKDWLQSKYENSNEYKSDEKKATFDKAVEYGAIGSSVGGGYIFNTNNPNYHKLVEIEALKNGAIGQSKNKEFMFNTESPIKTFNYLNEDDNKNKKDFEKLLKNKINISKFSEELTKEQRNVLSQKYNNEQIKKDLNNDNVKIGYFEDLEGKGLIKYDKTETETVPDYLKNLNQNPISLDYDPFKTDYVEYSIPKTQVIQYNENAVYVPKIDYTRLNPFRKRDIELMDKNTTFLNDNSEILNIFGTPFYYGNEYIVDTGDLRRLRLNEEKKKAEFLKDATELEIFTKYPTEVTPSIFNAKGIGELTEGVYQAVAGAGELVRNPKTALLIPKGLFEMGTMFGTPMGRSDIVKGMSTVSGATSTVLGTYFLGKWVNAPSKYGGQLYDKLDLGEKPIDFLYETGVKAKDKITGRNNVNEIDLDIAKKISSGKDDKQILVEYKNAKNKLVDTMRDNQYANPNFIKFIKEKSNLITKDYLKDRISLVKQNPEIVESFKKQKDITKEVKSKKVNNTPFVELVSKANKINAGKIDFKPSKEYLLSNKDKFVEVNKYNDVFNNVIKKKKVFENTKKQKVKTQFYNNEINDINNNKNEIDNTNYNESEINNINKNYESSLNYNPNYNNEVNINQNSNINNNINANENSNINQNVNANENINANANINANFNANTNANFRIGKNRESSKDKEVWITEYNNKKIRGYLHDDRKEAIKSGILNMKYDKMFKDFTIRKIKVSRLTKTYKAKKIERNKKSLGYISNKGNNNKEGTGGMANFFERPSKNSSPSSYSKY
jgi:hypothetical protein